MTEDQSLIAAILNDPDDDLPRLVYADWLDEHSEPERAELIRVQCELARLGPERITIGAGVGGPVLGIRTSGPGYWDFRVGDGLGCREGDRVDVLIHADAFKRGREPGTLVKAHGRVVVRVTDHGSNVHFVVKRDRDSKPWGGAKLLKRSRSLLENPCNGTHGAANWVRWAGAAGLLPSYSGMLAAQPFEFRRGFVGRVRCTVDSWARHGPAIVREHPVEELGLAGVAAATHRGREGLVYRWVNGIPGPTTPYAIPPQWFAHMPAPTSVSDWEGGYSGWPDAAAAVEALCTCALAWARGAA